MAEPLRHRQTKEAATDMFSLQPTRHISTLQILLQKSPMRDASFAGVEPEPWPTSRSVEATALTPSTQPQHD
jgi:hypothetical protein